MICIDASILDALQLLNRKKRGLGKKLRKLRDKIFGRKRGGSNPPPPPPPTSPTPHPARGIEFSCEDPVFNCEGFSCSYCTDVDVNPSTTSVKDKFQNCFPQF
ncbi:hypothetical protein OESDEN_10476 [Oesophagostomum dentatum]|uniref:Uncharacterized protein n=1 Tax=Oesophagostomum dentatum TaxID=61180 RepID=A0A0B1SWP8_OESDE|nr:hypothetical protein OESDEN_10476 [Oesophagostomum dentatum]